MTVLKPIAVAALALLASAAQADINIGISLPLTGPANGLGIPMQNGIKLWPASIGGEKLNVVVLDDGSDPTKGVQNTQRFLTQDKADIVADDVIELGPGDQLIVDGDVLEAASLEVDESLLTGEADPVVKGPGDQVLSGSFVVAGSGAYRATKVGSDAYAAKLAAEASKFTLVDSELRNGIKVYSNWPTIPQLYVKGEFVGGCDIIREMFQAGELQQLFADKGIPVDVAA